MMRRIHLSAMIAAAAAIGLSACGSSTETPAQVLAPDSTVSNDAALSTGDAAATAISTMTNNETSTGLSEVALPHGAAWSLIAPSFSSTPVENRTRTCYDANHNVVAACSPMSSVRTIVTHVTVDQSRSGTNTITGGATVTWTGGLHRISNDSLTRIFNTATPAVETSRSHSDLTVDHDTTSFADGTATRNEIEVAHDSVEAVVFNLPRSSNPYPASGKIVRVDSIHVVTTKGTATETRDVVRTVTIAFPPDANNQVTVTVAGANTTTRTCTFNVATRVLSACH